MLKPGGRSRQENSVRERAAFHSSCSTSTTIRMHMRSADILHFWGGAEGTAIPGFQTCPFPAPEVICGGELLLFVSYFVRWHFVCAYL